MAAAERRVLHRRLNGTDPYDAVKAARELAAMPMTPTTVRQFRRVIERDRGAVVVVAITALIAEGDVEGRDAFASTLAAGIGDDGAVSANQAQVVLTTLAGKEFGAPVFAGALFGANTKPLASMAIRELLAFDEIVLADVLDLDRLLAGEGRCTDDEVLTLVLASAEVGQAAACKALAAAVRADRAPAARLALCSLASPPSKSIVAVLSQAAGFRSRHGTARHVRREAIDLAQLAASHQIAGDARGAALDAGHEAFVVTEVHQEIASEGG